jgi:hypothetical protein
MKNKHLKAEEHQVPENYTTINIKEVTRKPIENVTKTPTEKVSREATRELTRNNMCILYIIFYLGFIYNNITQ